MGRNSTAAVRERSAIDSGDCCGASSLECVRLWKRRRLRRLRPVDARGLSPAPGPGLLLRFGPRLLSGASLIGHPEFGIQPRGGQTCREPNRGVGAESGPADASGDVRGEAKGPVPMRAAAVGGPPVRGENGDHGRVGAQSRAVAASSSDAALACAELPRDRQLGLSGWASARGQSAVVRGVDRGPRRMCGRTRRGL